MIVRRQLGNPVHPDWEPDMHWQFEFYRDDVSPSHPHGLAWVTAVPDGSFVYVDYILVTDSERRQGIATALLNEILAVWPNAHYNGATDAGEAFCRKFESAEQGTLP